MQKPWKLPKPDPDPKIRVFWVTGQITPIPIWAKPDTIWTQIFGDFGFWVWYGFLPNIFKKKKLKIFFSFFSLFRKTSSFFSQCDEYIHVVSWLSYPMSHRYCDKFEYINKYGLPSRTQKFEYINEYGMSTSTCLCTQISEYGRQKKPTHFRFFLQ